MHHMRGLVAVELLVGDADDAAVTDGLQQVPDVLLAGKEVHRVEVQVPDGSAPVPQRFGEDIRRAHQPHEPQEPVHIQALLPVDPVAAVPPVVFDLDAVFVADVADVPLQGAPRYLKVVPVQKLLQLPERRVPVVVYLLREQQIAFQHDVK
jgi:hypothetical protein